MKILGFSIGLRKRINVLPFLRANLSRSGVSWTWHLGPWSRNSRTGRHRVDLPGPFHAQTSGHRRPAPGRRRAR